MKIRLLYFVLFLFSNILAQGQTRHYWVFFSDKNGVKFNPYEYFDPKAIERRLVQGLPLFDSTDFPVRQDYINAVKNIADSLNVVSRWFNAVSVVATKEQISDIQNLPFVDSVREIFLETYPARYFDTVLTGRERKILDWQTDILGADFLKEENLTGKGIRIAVFDIGFKKVDELPFLKHVKVVKTYDFIRKKEFVYGYGMHGTAVLSCIAGKFGDKNIGLATDAEFLLARTEGPGEPFSEEENWLAAAEWADKNGAYIINSSLGYTVHRYLQYQMDGETSLVAKAANMAAQKGMIVVNAMGNEGDRNWKFLDTPADADSVLSIGGISFDNDLHINFSSYGPNSRCVLKPDLCAPGEVVAATPKGLKHLYGTSFATPLITGYVACIWQNFPDYKSWQIKQLIKKSGSLYPYYDYAHGYGIPEPQKILEPKPDTVNKFDVSISKNLVTVSFNDYAKDTYLFYHFHDAKGCISDYYVVDVEGLDTCTFGLPDEHPDVFYLMIHYGGQTKLIPLKN